MKKTNDGIQLVREVIINGKNYDFKKIIQKKIAEV
jgi:hypothetical protein